MRPVGLLAIDVDGTLVGLDLAIRPGARAAVARARQAGWLVTLATGRMYASARPYAAELSLCDVPLICYNGALVRTALGGETWLHDPVPHDIAQRVVDICRGAGFHLNVYLDDQLYVADQSAETRQYVAIARVPAQVTEDLAALLGEREEPTKLLLVAPSADMPAVRARLLAELGPLADRLFLTGSYPFFLELMAATASKGRALAAVARRLGFAPEAVAAVGDGPNDVDMLAWAGCGVAVGHPTPEVRAAARFVAPADADGVAWAVDHLLGGGQP